jgi:hypothetical protein
VVVSRHFDALHAHIDALATAKAKDTEERLVAFMERTGLGVENMVLVEHRGRFHPQWIGATSGFSESREK